MYELLIKNDISNLKIGVILDVVDKKMLHKIRKG